MGNTIDKKDNVQINHMNNLIKRIVYGDDKKGIDKLRKEKKGKIIMDQIRNSVKLKEKNIIYASISLAEEIIKINLHKDFNMNNHIYNSLIVFKDIDKYETVEYLENSKNCFINQKINNEEKKDDNSKINEENEELSNLSQIKSTENIIFNNLYYENKFNNKIAKLFDDFKFGKLHLNNNIELQIKSEINKIENATDQYDQAKIVNINTDNVQVSDSHLFKNRSFEDISLQEYLKMESERLKNDQNYINYKIRKESMEVHEQVEKTLQEDKFKTDIFNSSLKDLFSQRENNKNLKNTNKLDFSKNKHLNKIKKDSSTSVTHNKIINSERINKHNTFNTKTLKSSLTQKSFYYPNAILNTNNNVKTKFNLLKSQMGPQIKSMAISPSNISQNLNNNYTNTNTTKTTSRQASNNNKNLKNFIENNSQFKKENIFKIDLTRKKSLNNRYNSFNSSPVKATKNDNDSHNFTKNLNPSKIDSNRNKPPLAFIKIDIREFLKEEDFKLQENAQFITDTNKSYSEILKQNLLGNDSSNEVDVNDLIIEKQNIDQNGKIVLNS